MGNGQFTKEGQSLIFFSIRNQQPAIGNVVIESTEFPYCQIALLPDFLIF
jgi:hypothetical protein